MNVTFFQSECGDSAKISFCGDDKINHHIFIDAGYERTFKNNIRKSIDEIIAKKERIDYWIVSHIHDDHIGGIKKYIDYIESGELSDIVKNWIYNPPRYYLNGSTSKNISQSKSIGQGDSLFNYLHNINKLSLTDFTDKSFDVSISGLNIIFLGPPKNKLESLRTKYNSSQNKPLEMIEDDTISNAVAVNKDDYHINLKDFNLDDWISDVNIENGSSISFFSEFKGKKILWLADSHPGDVVKSLKEKGYSKKNKFRCEWVKVSHHGSKGNNNDDLFDLIECGNYLISANGENMHKLPSKELIARILRNSNRNMINKYCLWFTYNNDTLKSIFKNEEPKIYIDFNFEVFFNNERELQFSL